MTKRLTLPLLAAFCALSLARAADEPALTVEISSLDALSADMARVGEALSMPRLACQATNGLAKLLGAEALACVDMSRPLTTRVLFRPGGDKLVGATSIPLKTDARPFTDALTNRFEEHAEAAGIHCFSIPRSPRAGALPRLYVASAPGGAVVGTESNAVSAIVGAAAVSAPAQAGSPAGVLTFRVNVPAWLPTLDRLAAKNAPTVPSGARSGQVCRASAKPLTDLAKQIGGFEAAVSARKEGLQVSVRTVPVAGSRLAQTVTSLRAPSRRFLCAMPPDALAAAAGTGAGSDAFPSAAAAGSGQPSADAWRAALSGEYAMGVVPAGSGGGLALLQVFGLSDRAKAEALAAQLLPAAGQGGAEKRWGNVLVSARPGRQHGGVAISTYACSRDAAAAPMPVRIFPELTSFQMELAFTADVAVLTLGPSAVTDAALDRLAATGPAIGESRAFRTLFGDVGEEPVKVFQMSPVALLKALLRTVPDVSQDLLAMIPDDTSGVAGYSCVKAGGALAGDLRIGYDELSALRGGSLLAGALFARAAAAPAGSLAPTTPEAARSRCQLNLRRLAVAKEHAALDQGLANGADVSVESILQYLPGKTLPACPAGGAYAIRQVGRDPECSAAGHTLK